MYILTGSYANHNNVILKYIENIQTKHISVEINDEQEEVVVQEVNALAYEKPHGTDEEVILLNYKAIFEVFYSEEEYNVGIPSNQISFSLLGLTNANTATPEEIVDYVLNNDPNLSTFNKLI